MQTFYARYKVEIRALAVHQAYHAAQYKGIRGRDLHGCRPPAHSRRGRTPNARRLAG